MNSRAAEGKGPTWAACACARKHADTHTRMHAPCPASLHRHDAWRALQARGRDANLDKNARGRHPALHGSSSCREEGNTVCVWMREKGVTAQVLPNSISPHTQLNPGRAEETEIGSAFIMEIPLCVCLCLKKEGMLKFRVFFLSRNSQILFLFIHTC